MMNYIQLLCIAVILFGSFGCDCYHAGDIVKMSTKTRGSKNNEWTEVTGRFCPRFQWKRSIKLPLNHKTLLEKGTEIKLAFSFDNERFITPFITIVDLSKGVHLEFLEFTLIYSGTTITDVKWKTHYNEEEEASLSETNFLSLTYQWEAYSENDLDVGIGSLLVIGFLSTVLLMIFLIYDFQVKSETVSHSQWTSATTTTPPSVSSPSLRKVKEDSHQQ